MLTSLSVQASGIRSPRWAIARSQKRANFSGVSCASQPPEAANQRGEVKWWNVTIGVRLRSWHVASMRR